MSHDALDDTALTAKANSLVIEMELASPSELREAARQLDDIGNDPATSAELRALYRALSDVIKSWPG
jgi:hypothetical protein